MTRMKHNRRRWANLFGAVVGLALMHSVATQASANGRSEFEGISSRAPVSADDHGVADLAHAGGAERLIPFQAYLTDTEGRPIEGQRCLKFQIYVGPTGDSQPFVWDETHEDVPVHKGMVNVLLGSVTPFPEGATFDAARYVGVSVGEICDALIALQPRQQIISAMHAVDSDRAKHAIDADHAVNSDRLGGSPGNFLANSAEITPIGAIIPWFGNPAILPLNWTLCDGRTISDPESQLNGIAVPDMRASFPRGETDTNRDLPAQGPSSGGSDTDSWHVPDHSHGINVADAGAHQHAITAAGGHQHQTSTMGNGTGLEVDHTAPWGLGDPTGARNAYYTAGFAYITGHSWHLTSGAGSHTHPCVSAGAHTHSAGSSNAGAASGTINTVPRYVALHYIIRIK